MADLPIRRIVMYKHGVGYFERRGHVQGTSLRLSFPREAMDDVLKSLVAIDLGTGHIRGIDYETPEDRATRLAKGSIHLSDGRSLLDLLRDLRGRSVRIEVQGQPLEGRVIGVDLDEERPLHTPLVSLVLPDGQTVRTIAIRAISQIAILEQRATEDLAYFLRASQSEEDRRAATLRLSEGDHDLLVGYVAPAPAWRVSYRLLFEQSPDAPVEGQTASPHQVLIQGWGLFDNQLDEDLEEVLLTFVAGMPVSFRYRLYEPHTPERPLVQDEERTVAAPVEFFAMAAAPPAAMMAPPAPMPAMRKARSATLGMADDSAAAESFSIDAASQSTVAVGVGEDRGALFQYKVVHPISVARGQSAMVPIVGQRLNGRKELLYNGRKQPKNPVASLRMRNETGLTLERGPVTVIEEGDYAGEALLPFTRPGGDMIVAYAIELGISVIEQPKVERVTSGLQVRDSVLFIQEWETQSVVYTILSTLQAPVDLTIEQTVPAHYTLYETPTPAEQAQGMARWTVACAPGTETAFTVRYRRMISRREQVRAYSLNQLQEFVRQRFLDENTYKGLSEILATYNEIDQRQARLRQIEQERNQLYKRQQQTQGSLGPLGRDGEEGKLRARYVAQLNELENTLNALTNEENRLNAEIRTLEQQVNNKLLGLSRG